MQIPGRIWMGAIVVVAAAAFIWTRVPWLRHRPVPPAIPDRSATSPLNRPGGGLAPAEAYEVYSALYQAPGDEPLVFSADSVTDIPQVNGSCLRPSTPEEHQLTDAFEAANRQEHHWEQKFSISQGYLLISRTQANEALDCLRSQARDTPQCQAYKQVRHVRYLGVPGFDRTHTHALVSVVRLCGRYCGNGGIFEVEKAGGTWRRSEPTDFTRECSWMY